MRDRVGKIRKSYEPSSIYFIKASEYKYQYHIFWIAQNGGGGGASGGGGGGGGALWQVTLLQHAAFSLYLTFSS